ncbi:MAG: membrane protein insertion efficiency factor YidD [Candidatus Zixiibacteriota bacterium]|nr:MAG: membrane protein insertion efficiency factor YidD [candidate division Zixibacteria bacterium]
MSEYKISIGSYPLLFLITLYRYTLSPLIGGSCRFYPSCSHYAENAIKRYGLWQGAIMAVKRILRCHPWDEGGYDPVPEKRVTTK